MGVLPGALRVLWLWDGEETEGWEARAEAGSLVVATIPLGLTCLLPQGPSALSSHLCPCSLTSVQKSSGEPVGLAACLQLLLGHGQSVFPACLLLTPLICPRPLLARAILQLLPLHFPAPAFYLAQPGVLPHPPPCLGSLSTLPEAWGMSLISYASFPPQDMLACSSEALEGRAHVSFCTKLGPLEPTRQEILKSCGL